MIYVIHWFVNILTLGLVSIATITTTTYHVDEPISELNDLSLNEVFEDNIFETTFNSTSTYITAFSNNPDNGLYYLRLERNDIKDFQTMGVEAIPNYAIDPKVNSVLIDSVIRNIQNQTLLRVLIYNPNNNLITNQIRYVRINLTDLGIDNLTQAQMDEWYDIYVQAKANNGVYIESTSHLNNNIHLVDVSVMVISFAFWVWLFKFLKGVIF